MVMRRKRTPGENHGPSPDVVPGLVFGQSRPPVGPDGPAQQLAGTELSLPGGSDAAEGNYERRDLSVFVLDVSSSLQPYAQEYQAGVDRLFDVLTGDELASVSVDACIVQFATAARAGDFQSVALLQRPQLHFGGSTALEPAIMLGLDRLEQRLRELAAAGIPVNKSMFTVITDGYATGPVEEAVKRLRDAERKLRLNVFPIAAGPAVDWDVLNRLSARRKAALLKDYDFKTMFTWFSEVLVRYSRSRPGEEVENPPTDSWRASS